METGSRDQRRQIARINLSAIALCAFGFSQMIGYLTGTQWLRGIGAASTLAPFPKVFSEVDGVETFALDFVLEYTYADGTRGRLPITPEIFAFKKKIDHINGKLKKIFLDSATPTDTKEGLKQTKLRSQPKRHFNQNFWSFAEMSNNLRLN